MELKEYDKFEKIVIKEIKKKYRINTYLKVVKNLIRIIVEEFEKKYNNFKKQEVFNMIKRHYDPDKTTIVIAIADLMKMFDISNEDFEKLNSDGKN